MKWKTKKKILGFSYIYYTANFEAFVLNISLSKNLSFLKGLGAENPLRLPFNIRLKNIYFIYTFGVRIRDNNSTSSCCISSSSSWPTPDSSESSWWVLGVLPRVVPPGTVPEPAEVEEPIFGPPLVLLLLLPIPLEPLPELGLRKLVLSAKEKRVSICIHSQHTMLFFIYKNRKLFFFSSHVKSIKNKIKTKKTNASVIVEFMFFYEKTSCSKNR